jgi:hypothetical protein
MTSLTGGNTAANDIRKLMEQIIAERDAKFAPKQEGGGVAGGGMFDKPEVKANDGDVITDLLGYLEQKRTEALDSYQSKVMRRSSKPLPKPEDIDVSSFLSEAGLSSQPEPLTFTSDTAPALGEPSWSQVADNIFLDPSKEPAKPTLSEELLSREGKPVQELTDDEKFLRTGKLPKEGLMSPPATDDDMGLPDTRSSTEDDISLNNAFVKKMATSEGTTDHVDSLGIATLGYGVLPATARAYGFDPDSAKYSDRKVLAEDVYAAMYKDANTEYPDVFSNLDESQKIGALSLYINLGELPTGVVNALSGDVPDFNAARDSLASVVLGSPRDKNGNRKKTKDNKTIYTSNKGLSKRRAGEYNILMEGQAGFKPVHTVSVEGTKQNPEFVWKDSNNNEIHRYTPSITGTDKVYQGLDASSNMNDVRVD